MNFYGNPILNFIMKKPNSSEVINCKLTFNADLQLLFYYDEISIGPLNLKALSDLYLVLINKDAIRKIDNMLLYLKNTSTSDLSIYLDSPENYSYTFTNLEQKFLLKMVEISLGDFKDFILE